MNTIDFKNFSIHGGIYRFERRKFNKVFVFEINPEGLGQCLTLCSFDIVIPDVGFEIFFEKEGAAE